MGSRARSKAGKGQSVARIVIACWKAREKGERGLSSLYKEVEEDVAFANERLLFRV